MKNFPQLAIQVPDIYLPRPGIDLTKWAVIACDQYTSQPEYWQQVEKNVGDAPSTLHMIFPEVYLEQPGADTRIQKIQQNMRNYLSGELLMKHSGMVYVERRVSGKLRRGLVLALDLEHYDYNKGSSSLIRASEGTILERLPARIRIREGAKLELPHILVLIDDPKHTVIEPIGEAKRKLKPLYDFELMAGSGHLNGYLVNDPSVEAGVIKSLEKLADPLNFTSKYGLGKDKPVLLFAMGDGNHSLATAKAIWEKNKAKVGMEDPSRYALVEIENIHDEGLRFEPIHRVLFGLKRNIFTAMREYYQSNLAIVPSAGLTSMMRRVNGATGKSHTMGVVTSLAYGVMEISDPSSNLPVGSLQAFLDEFMQQDGAEKIDYVHGKEVVNRLGKRKGNVAFYLPAMNKSELFKTIILDGALPRKTFSMGEAFAKRFYMECREIA